MREDSWGLDSAFLVLVVVVVVAVVAVAVASSAVVGVARGKLQVSQKGVEVEDVGCVTVAASTG